ncbi:TetR family transcriptional regulator [Leifsonia poae]|uniref:HTH-type transcriptional repressor n=1 Tax=Leifsonia poae TaxID=110933 RepID=A0A9W6H713_9MICO|nr:TetR family transcriptional regulator [Leifsonia poae]GLJ74741.1 HTH-type transcriptional repressor [Leifsonia poae]
MARRYDRDESVRLLLEASAQEFARHGVGGARIDRIADRADVNKASIYSYIGNKDDLFQAALQTKLGQLADRVAIQSDDLAAYAGDLFDFLTAEPVVAWLFEQEGLHYGTKDVPALAERSGYFRSRVAAVRDALGGDGDAEAIYFSIIAMCYWYVAAPQLVRMVFGDVAPEEAKGRYRTHVVATAKDMVTR